MGGAAGYSALPSVDQILAVHEIGELLGSYRREPVVRAVRAALAEARIDVAAGQPAPPRELVAARARERLSLANSAVPRPLINATGVILNTNLGRAPLSVPAQRALLGASEYVDLEIDLADGGRGQRDARVASLICDLTGAEDALVTVNNASAVALALSGVARNRDVLVSRGHAVEIGGGFRVPEILKLGGARLVDVGTTNRTRIEDYEDAITERTAAILHVHPSNFRITGFVSEVEIRALALLANRSGLVLFSDNGSGSLVDTADFGLRHEPMPSEAIRAGADLVAFSGDKLLGGPQSGLLIGRRDWIARLRGLPLARAARPDKLILAALAATLGSFVRGREVEEIPVWQMIAQAPDDLRRRNDRFERMAQAQGVRMEVVAGESAVGGGSLPGETLPTWLLQLPKGMRASHLLRGEVPVAPRTQKGRCYLDLRTVLPAQEETLLAALVRARDSPKRQKDTVIDSAAE